MNKGSDGWSIYVVVKYSATGFHGVSLVLWAGEQEMQVLADVLQRSQLWVLVGGEVVLEQWNIYRSISAWGGGLSPDPLYSAIPGGNTCPHVLLHLYQARSERSAWQSSSAGLPPFCWLTVTRIPALKIPLGFSAWTEL